MKKIHRIKTLAVLYAAVCCAASGCSLIEDFVDGGSQEQITYYNEATRTKVKYQQAAQQEDTKESEAAKEKKRQTENIQVCSAAEFFLEQLSEGERQVFRQIYSGLKGYENNIYIENGVIKQSEICDFISFCTAVSPDINYISSEYTITVDQDGYVTGLEISYEKSRDDADSEKAELERAANEILQGLDSDWDDFDKVKYIHDRIVAECDYSEGGRQPYSAYGCLILNEAVCEGYSKAMLLLCQKAGIECIPVLGKGVENGEEQPHIWNKIMLDGQWYNFDLTWDDPVSDMGKDYIRYDYFGITDSEISADHIIEDNRFMNYPAAESSENNYYMRSGFFVRAGDSPSEIMAKSVKNAMENNDNYARIKCADDEIFQQASLELFGGDGNGSETVFDILSQYSQAYDSGYDYTSYSVIKNENSRTLVIKLNRV